MAVILNTRSSVQAATKIIEKAFTNRAVKAPPLYKEFFNIISTDPKRTFATFMPYAELGTLRYKPEGQAPVFDQPFELIPTTFDYFTFSLGASVTEEAQTEDAIGFMGKLPRMLSDSEQVTKDLTFWNVFNLAFSTNVVGSDGLPLCSSVHPLAARSTPTGVVSMIGQTQSNYAGAIQLTAEALQQGYISFQTLLSDRGLPRYRTPVYLVVGPQLQKVAEEILGTPNVPYSNNNTINVIRDTVTLKVSRYITSSTAWFLMAAKGDIEGNSHSLIVAHKWENRVHSWMDPATKNFNIATSFRSTYGWISPWGFYGSQGA